jgi:hypothetical protein
MGSPRVNRGFQVLVSGGHHANVYGYRRASADSIDNFLLNGAQ